VGAAMPIYKPEYASDQRRATAFVCSEVGQRFSVKVENASYSGDISCRIFIDGRKMKGTHLRPSEHRTVKGARTSALGISPFIFTNLKVKEDDEDDIESTVNLAELGYIEVRIHRVVLTDINPVPLPPPNPDLTTELDPVSEKAKKVGWHSVMLGEEMPARPRIKRTRCKYVGRGDKPWLVFRFRYQPRDLLEADGIITTRALALPNMSMKRSADDGDLSPHCSKRRNTVR